MLQAMAISEGKNLNVVTYAKVPASIDIYKPKL